MWVSQKKAIQERSHEEINLIHSNYRYRAFVPCQRPNALWWNGEGVIHDSCSEHEKWREWNEGFVDIFIHLPV